MVEIFRSLKAAEIWIYIILSICAIFPLRKLILSIQEYRGSLFGMEKDNARAKLFQSVSLLVVLSVMAIGEFVFVTFAGGIVPSLALLPTPTLNIQATITPASEGQNGISPVITPPADTAQATTTGINPVGDAGGSPGGGCIPGKVEWTDPKPGTELKGNVELKGTVNITDFGFYKYEYSQDNTHWITIQAGTTVVTNGLIGNWETSLLTSGDYSVRLIVSNNKNEELAPCLLQVKVIQK